MQSSKQLRGSVYPATHTFLSREICSQRDCVVVLCIVGTVHKCHVATPVGLKDRFDHFGLRIQFGKIPSLKLCLFGWVMVKLLPKVSAGCDILKPGIKTQGGLLQTTRPQPLNQESNAIVLAGRVVSTL